MWFILINGCFEPILLKNFQIGILRISAKSTSLLKLCEDSRERFQEATSGPVAHFS
jgi:hypothetical protein